MELRYCTSVSPLPFSFTTYISVSNFGLPNMFGTLFCTDVLSWWCCNHAYDKRDLSSSTTVYQGYWLTLFFLALLELEMFAYFSF